MPTSPRRIPQHRQPGPLQPAVYISLGHGYDRRQLQKISECDKLISSEGRLEGEVDPLFRLCHLAIISSAVIDLVSIIDTVYQRSLYV
jgi:hypothetical protein